MKKIKWALLVLLGIIVFGIHSINLKADEYYDIESYQVDIQVTSDNNYHVTEEITVMFYGDRHGIYREIDLNHQGMSHEVKDIIVTGGAGQTVKTEIEEGINVKTIIIGDEEHVVTGLQVYRISYVYVGNTDINEGFDAFYYNVIGTGWNAMIEKGTFSITMPKAFSENELSITTGLLGNRTNDHVHYEVDGLTIVGETTSRLEPYEGITLNLVLPEGYYEGGEPWIKEGQILFFFGLFGMALIVVFFYAKRQNNLHMIEKIRVEKVPDHLNCAEMAYIYRGGSLRYKDIGILLIQWASEGAIEIEDITRGKRKAKDTQFIKKAELAMDKPEYEKALFQAMFQHGNGSQVYSSQLKNTFYNDLWEAKREIKSKYSGDHRIIDKASLVMTIVGLAVLSILFVVAMALMGSDLLNSSSWFVFAISFFVAAAFTIDGLVVQLVIRKLESTAKWIAIGVMVMLSCVYGGILIFLGLPHFEMLWRVYPQMLVLMLVIMAMYIISIGILTAVKRYTSYGLECIEKVIGFKEYINELDIERINEAEIKTLDETSDNTLSRIQSLLPYAMVFKLTNVWQNLMNQVTSESHYVPYWYRPARGGQMDDFTKNLQGTIANLSTSPSSSGSGSGGSSGGGAGGGGGGSW
jgi:uncharacterized membrane protein YgcG